MNLQIPLPLFTILFSFLVALGGSTNLKIQEIRKLKLFQNERVFNVDESALFKRLANGIQFETISWAVHESNFTELGRFRDFIIKTFPLVHSSDFVSYEIVNNYSLLYTVEGKNKSLQPYMLTAHLDVVPVSEAEWSVPPFEGVIKDNILYGRGTLDDKGNVMAILEAMEYMLRKGIQPERGFYVGFGHDEEASGVDGAGHISKILMSRGVKLLYLLDEGFYIRRGEFLPGIDSDKPIALVGVTEKGYLTVKLSVNTKPGHSSLPSGEMAISILAKALSKFEVNTHRNMFGKGPEKEMLRNAAAHARNPFNYIYGDVDQYSEYLKRLLENNSLTNAMIRTTTALTLINGGIKENVLPSNAFGLINHRVHPAQSISEVLEIDKSLVNDSRVRIEITREKNAHPISPHNESSYGFQVIKKTISELMPDLIILPACLVANTDTRWYLNLTDSLYRFSVFDLDNSDSGIIHGNDERITLNSYIRMINFYFNLINKSNFES